MPSFVSDEMSESNLFRGGANTSFRSGIVREFIFFFGSTVGMELSRLVVAVTAARWLGPEKFGVWNALNVLLAYGAIVGLGVPNAMNREVPILLGRGQRESIGQMIHLAFAVVLIGGILAGVIIAGSALIPEIPTTYRSPLLLMGFFFAGWQIYSFLQMVLKCFIRFDLNSAQQLVGAAVMPAIVLPLTIHFGISGFIAGHGLVVIVLCVFILLRLDIKMVLPHTFSGVGGLVRIGMPLVLQGIADSLIYTVDRMVILAYLGTTSLGYYTLAICCVAALRMVPVTISQQMYPRMALKYGETRDPAALVPLMLKQGGFTALAVAPVFLVVYFGLPHLVETFLPMYRAGLEPAKIVILGLVLPALLSGPGNFLNTVNMQAYSLVVIVLAVLINVCMSIVLVKSGWGLNGVAIAAAVAYSAVPLTLALISARVIAAAGRKLPSK